MPPYTGIIPAPEAALHGLCKAIFHAGAALAESRGKGSPALISDENLTRADGIALLNDLAGDFGNFLDQGVQESWHVGASGKIGALPGPHGQKIRSARRLCRD